jgi:hypothetical protein
MLCTHADTQPYHATLHAGKFTQRVAGLGLLWLQPAACIVPRHLIARGPGHRSSMLQRRGVAPLEAIALEASLKPMHQASPSPLVTSKPMSTPTPKFAFGRSVLSTTAKVRKALCALRPRWRLCVGVGLFDRRDCRCSVFAIGRGPGASWGRLEEQLAQLRSSIMQQWQRIRDTGPPPPPPFVCLLARFPRLPCCCCHCCECGGATGGVARPGVAWSARGRTPPCACVGKFLACPDGPDSRPLASAACVSHAPRLGPTPWFAVIDAVIRVVRGGQ